MLVLAMQFSRNEGLTRAAGPRSPLRGTVRPASRWLKELLLPHNGTEMCRCTAVPGSREN